MPLSVGTRLGPYEVVAQIGAGGMGEVYKGRDARLDRTVAMKVLPSHLAANAELRERFEREARAVSALNHPHICTLYDVGREQEIDFLVMEYVEGETVASRLERSSLPVADALRYAIQVAEALDMAHRQGIIHRDLKPANMMITASGIKLLDFGLAKLRESSEKSVPFTVSALPTVDRELTLKGTILGTLQYMSPEQVEGKDTDGRTDIFALGVVLYEMLTGRKAFDGKSHVSLMAAILERDPDPVSSVRPVSPALDRIINICLQKDPEDRWQTAREVIRELKWAAANPEPAAAAPPVVVERRGARMPWAIAIVLLAAFLAALVPAIRHLLESPREIALRRFTIEPPVMPNLNAVTISPDGTKLAYYAVGPENRPMLWVRSLDSLAAEPVAGTESASIPFWSADSRYLVFVKSDDRRLRKLDLLGGSPQIICDAPEYGGATWDRTGRILFSSQGRLYRVSSSGGMPELLPGFDASRDNAVLSVNPHFLPDNLHFLFTVVSNDPAQRGIYLGSIETSDRRRLVDVVSMAVYSPEGFILYQRDGTLMAQSFDAESLELGSESVPVAEGLSYNPINGRSSFSVSTDGTLVYATASAAGGRSQITWYDRSGKSLGQVGKADSYQQVRLSPDEKSVAYTRRNPSGDLDVWILELATGIASRLTSDPSDETDPVWSGDGRRVAYNAPRQGSRNIYVKTVGDIREETLLSSDELAITEDWSRDGKTFMFRVGNLATKIYSFAPGDKKPTKLFEDPAFKDEVQFSPDGRSVAFNSNESGSFEVYVASFPSFTEKRQVSNSGGGQARWRNDGRELFYRTPDGKLMAVDIKPGASLESGIPKLLFQTRITTGLGSDGYSVTGDGQRFLVLEPIEAAQNPPITVVLNWVAGLPTMGTPIR